MITHADVYQRLVKDVMQTDVVTISSADTIHEALSIMGENRVSALPVVDYQDECVGILSRSDLMEMTRDLDEDIYQLDEVDPSTQQFLLEKLIHSMGGESVQSFMSESVTTIQEDAKLIEATKLMLSKKIHHLPVVNSEAKLVGILSTMDILAEFVKSAPQ